MIPVSSPGSTPRTFSASVGIESKYSSKESAEHDRSLEGNSQVKSLSSSKKSQEELRSELIRREQEHSGENLSDEGSQGTSESIDDLSDDEVLFIVHLCLLYIHCLFLCLFSIVLCFLMIEVLLIVHLISFVFIVCPIIFICCACVSNNEA